MEVYLFLVAIGMVAAQGEVPQQVPVQQNQETHQVPVGQAQPNIQIQQQQEQILQQQQRIIQQQQQQQAVNMDQQGHQGVHHAAGGGRNLIRDRNHIQDREHLKVHLNGIIGDDTADLSEKDLQLHYFKAHDYDNNMKLDGLEILKAVSHFHSEGGEADPPPPLDDHQLMQLIDPILAEDDHNRDGYVDYPEFAANKS